MTLVHGAEPRSAAVILDSARELIDPEYRALVDKLPAEVRHIGGYHIGWWDSEGNPTSSPGKAIRPALAVASAAAMMKGASDSYQHRVIAAALTVELVHDFTQLHDDVMDVDRIRRNRPTTWAQFGVGPAILTGDMFMATAIELLAQYDVAAVKILMRALHRLCEGQTADLAFERQDSVELAECIKMSDHKTAALMSACCELGAWAACADSERAACMRQFGLYIGRTFQLVDDVLGIFGDPAVTGKPLHADLLRRKKSLPVVAALNSKTAAAVELARRYTGNKPVDDEELAHLAQLVEQAGGRRWAEQAARESRMKAEFALRAACPEPSAGNDLVTLADLILSRDR